MSTTEKIKSEVDEIFISGATVNDIQIIDAVTANQIVASGNIATSVRSGNTGIQSSTSSGTTTYSNIGNTTT